MGVKGYKVFNEDWTCRDKEYHCPGIFKEDIDKDDLKVCINGMHFCKKAIDCFNYYKFDTHNHVCEVEALGDISEDGDKCCTNKLKIIREIPWEEVLTIVNIGNRNTGIGNIGDDNSGEFNIGNSNAGRKNTGDHNSGNYNSGDCNDGQFNSGNNNSGYFNTGNENSGSRNTGNFNRGYRNTGDFNNGDYNSGDFNKADRCSGVFCTKTDKIRMFNKPTDWTYRDWCSTRASNILCYTMPLVNRQPWWNNLKYKDKKAILELPNFDKDIFKEITGIDVGDCENFRKRSENHGKKL